jgi:hypothetical protein
MHTPRLPARGTECNSASVRSSNICTHARCADETNIRADAIAMPIEASGRTSVRSSTGSTLSGGADATSKDC